MVVLGMPVALIWRGAVRPTGSCVVGVAHYPVHGTLDRLKAWPGCQIAPATSSPSPAYAGAEGGDRPIYALTWAAAEGVVPLSLYPYQPSTDDCSSVWDSDKQVVYMGTESVDLSTPDGLVKVGWWVACGLGCPAAVLSPAVPPVGTFMAVLVLAHWWQCQQLCVGLFATG